MTLRDYGFPAPRDRREDVWSGVVPRFPLLSWSKSVKRNYSVSF